MSIRYRELSLDTIWNLSWDNAKKYFLPIFVMNIAIYMCTNVISSLFYGTTQLTFLIQHAIAYNASPEMLLQQCLPALTAMLPMVMLGSLIGWLLASFFQIVLYRLLIDGVKGQEPAIGNHIKAAWPGYFSYIGITLLNSIIIGLATCFCILPGIFLAVRLLFVPIIAANKPQLTLGEVFRESWDLTRGHFWTLIGYAIVVFLINLVGLICCCVGVIFTQVITQFMLANVYYTLSFEDEEYPTGEETSASFSEEDNKSEGHYDKTC